MIKAHKARVKAKANAEAGRGEPQELDASVKKSMQAAGPNSFLRGLAYEKAHHRARLKRPKAVVKNSEIKYVQYKTLTDPKRLPSEKKPSKAKVINKKVGTGPSAQQSAASSKVRVVRGALEKAKKKHAVYTTEWPDGKNSKYKYAVGKRFDPSLHGVAGSHKVVVTGGAKGGKPAKYRVKAEQERRERVVQAQKEEQGIAGKTVSAIRERRTNKLRVKAVDKSFAPVKREVHYSVNPTYAGDMKYYRHVKRLRTRNALTTGIMASGASMLADTGNAEVDEMIQKVGTVARIGGSAYRRRRVNKKTGEDLLRKHEKYERAHDAYEKQAGKVIKRDQKLQKTVKSYEENMKNLKFAEMKGDKAGAASLRKKLIKQDRQILKAGIKKQDELTKAREYHSRMTAGAKGVQNVMQERLKDELKRKAAAKAAMMSTKFLAVPLGVILFFMMIFIPIFAVLAVGGGGDGGDIQETVDLEAMYQELGPDAKALVQFLERKGLDQAQIITITTTAYNLSGLDHTRQEAEPNTGVGLFMWRYNGGSGRRKALEDYCAAQGKTWQDLQCQLDFFWKEYEGGAY